MIASECLSPSRRQLVEFLDVHGETWLEDLARGLGRRKSNVCQDLTFLRRKGLVSRRYEGQRAFYRAVSG